VRPRDRAGLTVRCIRNRRTRRGHRARYPVGPDAKDVLDVFLRGEGRRQASRAYLCVGRSGHKQQGGPNGDVFYDNVMLWAVKNGMVGVNMQRTRAWRGTTGQGNRDGGGVGASKRSEVQRESRACFHLGAVRRNVRPARTSVILICGDPWASASKESFSCHLRLQYSPGDSAPVTGGSERAASRTAEPRRRLLADAVPAHPVAVARVTEKVRPPAGRRHAVGPVKPSGMVSSKVPFMVSLPSSDPPNTHRVAETLREPVVQSGPLRHVRYV
jgi:hypothetical protein